MRFNHLRHYCWGWSGVKDLVNTMWVRPCLGECAVQIKPEVSVEHAFFHPFIELLKSRGYRCSLCDQRCSVGGEMSEELQGLNAFECSNWTLRWFESKWIIDGIREDQVRATLPLSARIRQLELCLEVCLLFHRWDSWLEYPNRLGRMGGCWKMFSRLDYGRVAAEGLCKG